MDEQASLKGALSGPVVNVEMIMDQVGDEEIESRQTRIPPGEAKAAAAQAWTTTLTERGRWMALRYTARDLVIDA